MKKLFIILGISLSSFGFSQVDLGDNGRFQYLMDSINNENAKKPCLKQGDNDIVLRSIIKNIFIDPAAFSLVKQYESLSNFYVVGSTSDSKKILFTEWLVDLKNYYTTNNCTIIIKEHDEYSCILFYNADKIFISKVVIYWDQSYDSITYSNLRHIVDSRITDNN
jgi:hypothetical protein